LTLAATWVGAWAFALLVAVAAALAAWEWTRLCGGSWRWMIAGVIYIGLPVAAILWLRAQDRETALWLLLVVWAVDIGAFAVGSAIRGPRLAPRISPNKTWSGLVGGIVAAAAVGWGLALGFVLPVNPAVLAGLSALLALVAQAGDLLESGIKRHFSVKDTSALIPGHGGLLDRIDGVMTAAPAAAAFCLIGGGGITQWR
jgi:phosphatidate cytidylyltransferase